MRKWKSGLKWVLPAVALLLVLAGCQPVGGFDVDKMLLGNAEVKSAESNLNLSLHFEPNSTATQEDQEIIELINSLTLKLDNVKVQNTSTMSATGELDTSKFNIPFKLSVNEDALAVQVEGAKEPFYLPLTNEMTNTGLGGLNPEKSQELVKQIQSIVIKHLPNPSVIGVTKVNETIHGEPLSLTKLHAEVSGDELTGLLKTFLEALSNDQEGLKTLIGGLYDNLLPVLKEEGLTNLQDLNSGLGNVPLDDRDAVIAETYTKLQKALDLVVLSYDETVNQMLQEQPDAAAVLSKDTKLTTDIYLDSSYKLRKQNLELKVNLPQSEGVPFKSFSYKVSSEQWNVNEAIQADLLNTDNGVDLSVVPMTPGTILRNLDPQSEVYNVFRNELGLTNKLIPIDPEFDDTIVKQNTTMIPLRYLAENLDAAVQVKDGNIVITEDLDGGQLIFKPGAKTAIVNGNNVDLPQPVFIDAYGRAYAPLRVLAEGLQAHVEWNSDGSLQVVRN
ncbi:copper amine oxidase N-terminal domain-containing protein [Paenibacillus physcomitrellae]|uniref:Copper amine oxidase-like N-terminal domain-containing protein n=1 Tax=Paenibacillus physcomitrellae TaxID=1619311 RepID=A0ABQ1GJ06_9BACL|nr:copper amine oxidase N-terminal domain-containing protein [Paenibacillus physcomitrellae]GGA44190.1 hypothetical protein GCM10010917_31840 [Paenibacillus physcomitrellae]